MPRPATTTQELALPVASLLALREALEADVGEDTAARALRQAGHVAGDALYPLLTTGSGDADLTPSDLPESEFWHRVSDLFAARGWGHLQFGAPHPGVATLESGDWVEADPHAGKLRPSCHFTTGLLANLLGHAAGETVGVLEVECRSRGDLHCRFAFGGPDALQAVYGALARGEDLEQTLGQLA